MGVDFHFFLVKRVSADLQILKKYEKVIEKIRSKFRFQENLEKRMGIWRKYAIIV